MKVIADNRRARFDYDIVETVEAGIVLTGQEAKSCRLGNVSLLGSYVSFLNGHPILKQAKISPYPYASGLASYDPGRDRPLLLTRSELTRLDAAQAEKGMAIIPLSLHAGRYIKITLALARGRKRFDKRHRIKEREMDRRERRSGMPD